MLSEAMAQLKRSARAIEQFVRDLSDEEVRWRPGDGEWCVLEVINHLVDEETEDFRKRLDLTLRHPEQPWPFIDPEGWAVDRNYMERDFDASLATFLAQRDGSLVWLKSLDRPDWNRVHVHPRLGTISAGDLLTSWVGHDLLHLAQLARVRYQHFALTAEPHSPDYAGPWR